MPASVRAVGSGTFSGSTSIIVPKPTGTAEGDVIIVSFAWSNNNPGTVTLPTNWAVCPSTTALKQSGSSSGHCSYKVAGVGEPADYTFSWPSSSTGSWGSWAIQGADTAAPFDANTDNAGTASTSHVCLGVDPTTTDALLICVACSDNAGTGLLQSYTPPTGMTEDFDSAATANRAGVAGFSQALTSGAATGDKTATAAFSAAFVTFTLTLKAGVGATNLGAPHLGSVLVLFAPSLWARIAAPHFGPVGSVFVPALRQRIAASHLGPTTVLLAPTQIRHRVSAPHLGPTSTINVPSLRRRVLAPHAGPTAVLHVPGLRVHLAAAHVGPTTSLFPPALRSRIAVPHFGPTLAISAPALRRVANAPHLGPTATFFVPSIEAGGGLRAPHLGPLATVFESALRLRVLVPHIGPTTVIHLPVLPHRVGAPVLGPLFMALSPKLAVRITASHLGPTLVIRPVSIPAALLPTFVPTHLYSILVSRSESASRAIVRIVL